MKSMIAMMISLTTKIVTIPVIHMILDLKG